MGIFCDILLVVFYVGLFLSGCYLFLSCFGISFSTFLDDD